MTRSGWSVATAPARRRSRRRSRGAAADRGRIDRGGEIGYLPQDPRSGDPEALARTRILDARGLGKVILDMGRATDEMGSPDPRDRTRPR